MDQPAGDVNASHYKGSQLMGPIANMTGLPIDQFNFLFSEILALILALCFRRFLPPKPSNTLTRHVVGMIFKSYIHFFLLITFEDRPQMRNLI